jgi:HAD superfamily hydrolase (TIGR01509 family)
MSDYLTVDADVALLDFDGLVIDTEYAGWRSWNELYERHGLRLAELDWALQCGRATIFEPWEHLEAAAAAPLDRVRLGELRLQRRDEFLGLLPGVREFLAATLQRGHRVGLVSNSPEEWILRNLARNDVDPKVFSVIICGDSYAAKPSPERYLAALDALRTPADDAVAVEDSAKGVQSAVAAGLRCVAVANRITRHSDLSEAQYRLESLDLLRLTRPGSPVPRPGARFAQPGVAVTRLVDVRVYLAADPRIAQALLAALGSEASTTEGAVSELVDVSGVIAGGPAEDALRAEAAAGAAMMLVLDRVLAHRGSSSRLHLVACLGAHPATDVVALILRQIGADGLLVVPASSPLADIVDLDTPALVLPCDEAAWGAALTRLTRCRHGGSMVTPTAMEQAMMAASVAARRSAALRGGVGAALVDGTGEVLLLGTAEVPRYGGGQYWDGDPDDARDHRYGGDPATAVRLQTVEKLLSLLVSRGGSIAGTVTSAAVDLLAAFDRAEKAAGVGYGSALARTFESLGRVVHAEMAVLCHAARLGIAVKGLTLCVTAGPCRQCLRHAVCAGIERLVHLGAAIAAPPDFLADSVTTRPGEGGRLELLPFEGITPGAYAELFRRDPRPAPAPLGISSLPPRWLGLSRAYASADVDRWRSTASAGPEEMFGVLAGIKQRLALI